MSLRGLRFSAADVELENEDTADTEAGAQRVARDVHDHLPVNDYVSGPGAPRPPETAAISISLHSLYLSLCI